MKGMQKIKRGRGFKGVVNYCAADRNARLLFCQNITAAAGDPKDIIRELARTVKIKSPEKPVWHNSLRLPQGEKIADEKWNAIVSAYMEEMGFTENHLFAVWQHADPAGQHIHIVASRVSLTGELYLGQNENLKSTKIIHAIEERFGLTRTSGVEKQNRAKRPKKQEIEKALRTGTVPARLHIQKEIDRVLTTSNGWDDFTEKLREAGVDTRDVQKDGRTEGLVFSYAGLDFGSAGIGKDYTRSKLLKKIKESNQESNHDKNKTRTHPKPTNAPTNHNAAQSVANRDSGVEASEKRNREIAERNKHLKREEEMETFLEPPPRLRFAQPSAATAHPRAPLRSTIDADQVQSAKTGRWWYYDRNTKARTGIFMTANLTELCWTGEGELSVEKARFMICESANSFGVPLVVSGDPDFINKIKEQARIMGVQIEGEPDLNEAKDPWSHLKDFRHDDEKPNKEKKQEKRRMK